MHASNHGLQLDVIAERHLQLTMQGDICGAEIIEVFTQIDAHVQGQPYWLMEVDISGLGHADPSSRRTAAERISKTPDYSMALYGGSLAQRAVSMLFLKVAELFNGNRDIATTFVSDRATAREWLRNERRRREG